MKLSALIASSVLLLSACANTNPQKAPACTGNLLLRGCKPVVYFEFNSAELSAEAKQNLDWAYDKMAHYPNKNMTVRGYADYRGDPTINLDLAKHRAQAVKDYITNKGIEADRIVVEFDNGQNQLCKVSTCQDVNRRAELDIYAANKFWSK